MRLSDIVNRIRRKFSELSNFARNPVPVAYRHGRRALLEKYEQATVPDGSAHQHDTDAAHNREGHNGRPVAARDRSSPTIARPDRVAPVVVPDARSASVATVATVPRSEPAIAIDPDFAYLQPGDRLTRGWVGHYTVGTCLQDYGWMRLYEGIQENGQEAVWIYEYCLSDTVFRPQDIQARRSTFKQLIDLNSRLGQGSDFRILPLRDVITAAQQPCYLITKALPKSQCLADYLATREQPFSAIQVHEFLRQVLQSLQYLQAYQIHWPDGSSQTGLPHGSLSLESFWIRFSDAKMPMQAETFFVYLSRLSVWEHLFYPGDPPIREIAKTTQDLGTIADDFNALGHIAFVLLTRNFQANPSHRQAWPPDPHAQSLYPFVCRLLGVGSEEPFKSPDTAIAALRALPSTVAVASPAVPPDASPATPPAQRIPTWLGLLVGLVLFGTGFMAVRWWMRGEGPPILAEPTCEEADGCVLTVAELDQSTAITYGFEPGSYWKESFSRSLSSPVAPSRRSAMLEESLETRAASSTLNVATPPPGDRQDLLTQIQRGQLQAGFIRGGQTLPPGLAETTVAYDGIVIFVVHSDAQRDRNSLKLIDGEISLAEVRQLFTQQQQTLGDANHPVQLYFPQGYAKSQGGADTIALFRELVFETPADKARFDAVQRQALAAVTASDSRPDSIYAHMVDAFESREDANSPIIGIGFDRISRMNGQCSVYPLTLTHEGTAYPILVGNDGRIRWDADLCADRGAYWVKSDIFDASGRPQSRYPLSYPMAVAHPDACMTDDTADRECQPPGQALANQLLSLEGQYLLSEVGLVPVAPIQRIRHFLGRGHDAVQ